MKSQEFKYLKGSPFPFGVSIHQEGTNFALFSRHAENINLCLFTKSEEPLCEIPLHPKKNKTGDVWHIKIQGLPEGCRYGYRIFGPFSPTQGMRFDSEKVILDPYARKISSPIQWGRHTKYQPLGIVSNFEEDFDWGEDAHPNIPMKDLIIYEMHVRGFTQDDSSNTIYPGSFLGVIEKIPYLKSLGVNAVEILPIHEFNEMEYKKENPHTGEPLCNYWGYSTVNFFAPMNRYNSSGDPHTTAKEFKMMVKELHKHGIEVILDVVFNHTAEGNEHGPTISFKGIDNAIYYILGPNGEYYNYSGCGNTLKSNHPIGRQFVLNSLRYWVTEMHVDGFRFDLASILTRGKDGSPLQNPPLIEAVTEDPILSKTKLIAEAWDAAGLYQVGAFPAEKGWAEWNGKYRDCIRKFIKGTPGMAGEFATRICGSQDLYGEGGHPYHSINFVTSHDGFTLRDLVSYEHKHNEMNGEESRDGANDNYTWNCGIEGPSTDQAIQKLRLRQMKNMYFALLISQGVPMIHMGDEYGHTKLGNNNTWCQDNRLNWFLWDQLKQGEGKEFFAFCSFLNKFRLKTSILKNENFLQPKDIIWHGLLPNQPDWSGKIVVFTLIDHEKHCDIYIAFNASHESIELELPKLDKGQNWKLILDTSQRLGVEKVIKKERVALQPYSSLLAQKVIF